MNQQHKMNVMLLCAGLGSRLRPFTEKTPKPAIPFLGAPLAAYSLELLNSIKVDNLVVNTHHLPSLVEDCLRDLKPDCKKLMFSNEPVILGSGGGIHKCLPQLLGHDDFLVMNGDEVILPEHMGMMDDFIREHKLHKPIATLLVTEHPEVGKKFGGVWTTTDNSVKMFSKTFPEGLENIHGHHFVGAMIFSDRIQHYFKNNLVEENILYETLTLAMSKGEEVRVFSAPMRWFETGNPVDFKEAAHYCADHLKINDGHWTQHLNSVVHRFGGYPAISGL